LLEKYPKQVKLVHKNYPLYSHRFAMAAAQAALAANEQGKFWEFHKKLFENFGTLSDDKINQIAAGLGFNMEKFAQDVKSPAVQSLIQRDLMEGKRIGIRGIPTVFINGRAAGGYNLVDLQNMVEEELKAKK
jgi:protein-disulfide isomerase